MLEDSEVRAANAPADTAPEDTQPRSAARGDSPHPEAQGAEPTPSTDGDAAALAPALAAADEQRPEPVVGTLSGEKRLDNESDAEYHRRLWALQESEFDRVQREQRQKRLKFLVERAGIYSKWLAEKLEARQKSIQTNSPRAPAASAAAGTVDAAVAAADDSDQGGSDGGAGEARSADRGVRPAIVDPDPETEASRVTRRRSARTSASADAAKGDRAGSVPADQSSLQAPESGRKKRRKSSASAKQSKRVRGSEFGRGAEGGDDAAGPIAAPAARTASRQPSLVTGCVMRDYQIVGMEWLISLYDNGLNGILADEMGLGKTLQTIAFLAHLREMGTKGPFLVVAPMSTLANWVSEVERFTPSVPVLLYYGDQKKREYLRKNEMNFAKKNYPVIVTSYEICMRDRKYLQNVLWRYIIIDEGHRIKNLDCKLIRELKSYKSANRLLLTGTPLQNNLSELWSLLNFLMPEIFDDLTAFEEWFQFANELSAANDSSDATRLLGQESRTWMVNSLHQVLKPFLLRRVKSEAAVDLPKKREYLLYAPLLPKQKELYDATLRGVLKETVAENLRRQHKIDVGDPQKENAEPEGGDARPDSDSAADSFGVRRTRSKERVDYTELSEKKYFESLAHQSAKPLRESVRVEESASKFIARALQSQGLKVAMMQLRKICNHPYLFDIEGEGGDGQGNTVETEPAQGSDAPAVKLPEIVAWSGKMLVLDRLLPALFERGHKVLVFSQMTRMLDIIADWCALVKGWSFCRIDGSVKIEDRCQQLHEFNTNPNTRLFLLSTRAGGLGINLTAADTVIIFDSDWNPQVDLQAQDRVHRIGQHRPVIVYRLITTNSVERRILDCAQSKRKLEKLVIHKGHFKGSRRYYKSNRETSLAELAMILASEEAEHANTGLGDTTDKIPHPESVLTNEVLGRILDRRPKAYEASAAEGVDEDETGAFAVVAEADADEQNDALAGMQDAAEPDAEPEMDLGLSDEDDIAADDEVAD